MIWRVTCTILVLFICGFGTAQSQDQVYFPATPASIPLILALEKIPELKAHSYVNHSQANALFIRGDAPLLLTGLAVGRKLYEQGVPLSIMSSHIAGFSYLVSAKGLAPLTSFKDLAGKKLWLPFPGSPLEEVCAYFAQQDGMKLGEDIAVGYTRFDATVQLLKSGKIQYAVLPEPFVSLAEKKGAIDVQLSLTDLWNEYTKSDTGYPQVVLLARQDWLEKNPEVAKKLIEAFAQSVQYVREKPQLAAAKTKVFFTFPEDIVLQALSRINFLMLYGEELKMSVRDYYHKIGRDIEDDFEAVY